MLYHIFANYIMIFKGTNNWLPFSNFFLVFFCCLSLSSFLLLFFSFLFPSIILIHAEALVSFCGILVVGRLPIHLERILEQGKVTVVSSKDGVDVVGKVSIGFSEDRSFCDESLMCEPEGGVWGGVIELDGWYYFSSHHKKEPSSYLHWNLNIWALLTCKKSISKRFFN